MLGALKAVCCLMCLLAVKMGWVAAQNSPPRIHQKSRSVSANVGENITLECFYDHRMVSKLFWYKQTLGEKPTVLISFDMNIRRDNLYGDYRNNLRIRSSSDKSINHLMISNLKSSDSGTYYCGINYESRIEFAEGTTVLVQDLGAGFPVWVHQWVPGSDQSNGSVTLQCSSKAPAQTGIYSCAVASCGRLLRGNGTKPDFEHKAAAEGGHSPGLVIFLGTTLVFTSVSSLSLAFFLCVMHKRSKSPAPVTANQEDGGNQHDVQYGAINIKKDRGPRRREEEAEPECVYSRVRQ